MGNPSHIDVAVIGAGPYGLSLGAHLGARGMRYRIFGHAMETWRTSMPQGMYLKSEGSGSNLSDPSGKHTLKYFCTLTGDDYRDWGLPIPIGLFIRYGEWFQKQLVPALEQKNVLNCSRVPEGFELQVEGGEAVTARSVVVSTGYRHSARVPEELAGLPQELVSHSSAHQSFESFKGKEVIVVGAGQSALESAALLREAGASPSLLVRRDSVEWGGPPEVDRTLYRRVRYPRTALGDGLRSLFFTHPSLPFYYLPRDVRRKQVDTFLGPFGAWWLRERVVDRMPIQLASTLHRASVQAGRVVLQVERGAQREELRADHVIAATGYHVGTASFPFLSSDMRQDVRWDDGSPILSKYFESSVPGLHFVGLASAYRFGPVMRFVAGAQITAPRLSAFLARRHKP